MAMASDMKPPPAGDEASLAQDGDRAQHEYRMSASDALTPGAPPAPPRLASPDRDQRKLAILLAEDNPQNQKLAVRLLESRGHTVEVAGNGRLALEAWRRGGHDLIIMDMMMPEMDGLEATRRIRKEERQRRLGTARIAIIAMTANVLRGDRERCLEAGMDGYVPKPVKPDILFHEIARVSGEAVDAMAEAVAVDTTTSQPIFDRADALSRVAEDADLLNTLLDMFIANAPNYVGEIDTALAARDWTRLARAAHTLNGILATFSARRGEAAARALEQAARSLDEGACRTYADQARGEVEAFLRALG